jgi:hypothetical protein
MHKDWCKNKKNSVRTNRVLNNNPPSVLNFKLRFHDPQISIDIQGLKQNHHILHPVPVDLANSLQ